MLQRHSVTKNERNIPINEVIGLDSLGPTILSEADQVASFCDVLLVDIVLSKERQRISHDYF